MLTPATIEALEKGSLKESLALVASLFPGQTVFSTSLGQEDQVITDTLFRNDIPVRVFTIDTGRLFNESYELLEKNRARYGKDIEIFFPEAADVEEYVREKGINGFYESVDNRKSCCGIRKVRPLNRALAGAAVWITGLRADQSSNRSSMKMIGWDEQRELYKFNPLLNWTYEEVLDYLAAEKVPYNVLHDRGFISIGCAPCTRAIEPGEEARAGRWWWEQSQKECGLHNTLVKQA